MKEIPGALTPWKEVNQLLAPDERFAMQLSHGNGFLLAPRHPSQISALLYFLHQEKIPFSMQDQEDSLDHQTDSVRISARVFSQINWYEHGVVEVGGGCSLSLLQQFLFERNHEVAVEGDPLISPKCSVAELILSGRTGGLRYREEPFFETILGVDLVTRDGTQVRWGGAQRSQAGGPTLHKLIWDLKSFPGVILKMILKTYPIPSKRLKLSWSFRQREALWQFYQELRQFSTSWEYLDVVLSGKPTSQEYIFAQISGLPEEMEAFSQLCPGYVIASQQDERFNMKYFFGKQKLKAYQVCKDSSLNLDSAEYLWLQEWNSAAWLLTDQVYKDELDVPAWKQYFWESFFHG